MRRAEIAHTASRLFGWFLIAYSMFIVVQLRQPLRFSDFGDLGDFLEFEWPLLPLFAFGILLIRGNDWHARWLGGAPNPAGDATEITFTRGRLRTYAFGFIGALAAFRALRRALVMVLPLPSSSMHVMDDTNGVALSWTADFQWLDLGLHVVLAILLLVGPLRIHRLLRGMRPKPGPRDGATLGSPALLRIGLAAFAIWFGIQALVWTSHAVFPRSPADTAARITSACVVGCFLWLGLICVRAVKRGTSWRGSDAVVGIELGAIFVLLELVPDAVREIMRGQDGSLGIGLWGIVGTRTLGVLLTVGGLCLAALGWAQYRRSRSPPESNRPEAEVFA